MNGEPEAIARVPPAPFGSSELNAAQSNVFAPATATAIIQVPQAPPGINRMQAGGCWITFLWLPTVANEVVRLCFGDASATIPDPVASDRKFVAGVEHDYWLPVGYTGFKGLSAGGGELSWHRSSR